MSFKTTKIKWAKKLLHAKMFVILTEKESCIAIDGADPFSFTDALALAAQSAELEMFHDSLGGLIKDHQTALAKLAGEPTNGTGTPATEPVEANKAAKATAVAKAPSKPAKATKATAKPARPVRAKTGGNTSSKAKAKPTAKKAKK